MAIKQYVAEVKKHMTNWIAKYKSHVPFLLEEIVMFFHRVGRPVYLGEVSTYISKNIELTEELIEELVEQGTLRKATPEEILKLDGRSDSVVYVLLDRPSPKLAHRP